MSSFCGMVSEKSDYLRYTNINSDGAQQMRAPARKRPLARVLSAVPEGTDLASLAHHARYVGSPEHKSAPSFAGPPRPRADATICDHSLNSRQKEITTWLRTALIRGAVGAPWEGSFPRYAWFRQGETVYEARLVNHEKGEYKGYPLGPDEWPKGLDEP